MSRFYLKRATTGRVYLSQIAPAKGEELLDQVNETLWVKAREAISDLEFVKREGYGYYTLEDAQ